MLNPHGQRDPLGTDTLDMIALRRPHPAERRLDPQYREDAIQTTGRRCRWGGMGILAAVFLGALACAVAAESRTFNDAAAQLLAAMSMFALIVVGAIIAAAGFNERNNQPLRAMARLELRQTSENTERLELLQKRADDIADQISELTERVAAVEKVVSKVPEYGKAIMDGFELGRGNGGDVIGSD